MTVDIRSAATTPDLGRSRACLPVPPRLSPLLHISDFNDIKRCQHSPARDGTVRSVPTPRNLLGVQQTNFNRIHPHGSSLKLSANFRLKVWAGLSRWHSAARRSQHVGRRRRHRRPVSQHRRYQQQHLLLLRHGSEPASFSGTGSYSFNIASDPNYRRSKPGSPRATRLTIPFFPRRKTPLAAVGTVFFTSNTARCPERQQVSSRRPTIAVPSTERQHTSSTTTIRRTPRRWLELWGLNLTRCRPEPVWESSPTALRSTPLCLSTPSPATRLRSPTARRN